MEKENLPNIINDELDYSSTEFFDNQKTFLLSEAEMKYADNPLRRIRKGKRMENNTLKIEIYNSNSASAASSTSRPEGINCNIMSQRCESTLRGAKNPMNSRSSNVLSNRRLSAVTVNEKKSSNTFTTKVHIHSSRNPLQEKVSTSAPKKTSIISSTEISQTHSMPLIGNVLSTETDMTTITVENKPQEDNKQQPPTPSTQSADAPISTKISLIQEHHIPLEHIDAEELQGLSLQYPHTTVSSTECCDLSAFQHQCIIA